MDRFMVHLKNLRYLPSDAPMLLTKADKLTLGMEYFNNERFWECHEVLEGVWKNTHQGEKELVQGIILVAAALVHYQKNETDICLSILKRAVEKFSNAGGKYYSIDVDLIRKKIAEMISTKKIEIFTI